jgi:hypothetical protein
MLLKNARFIELDHHVPFLRGAPRQSLYIAAAREGQVTAFGMDFKPRKLGGQYSAIRAISLHPTKPILAVLEGESDKISIVTLDGKTLSAWVHPCCEDCCFDENGDFLLSVGHGSRHTVEIQSHETNRWSKVSSADVEDPFGESSCLFSPIGVAGGMSLWLAAGQNGQRVYWLSNDASGVRADLESTLKNTGPSWFSPRGDEFLIITEMHAVQRYQYPQVRLLGEWPGLDDELDMLGMYLCYLDQSSALVNTDQGRLLVLDLNTMGVTEAIAFSTASGEEKGREMRDEGNGPSKGSTPIFLKRMKERRQRQELGGWRRASDISFFERLGDVIVFVYRRSDGPGIFEWKDKLLCVPVHELLDQMRS